MCEAHVSEANKIIQCDRGILMNTDSRQEEDFSAMPSQRLHGIRIARVSTVAFFLVTQLKEQVTRLAELGANVTLICSPGPELNQLALSEHLRYVPVRIERSIQPIQDLVAIFTLYRIFRRQRFDVVHTTTPKAGLVAGIAAYLARVPVRMHTYTGQVWVTLHGPKRWMARFADRVIGWLATQCYADSPSQRTFLISEGIIDNRKIKVIGRGSLSGVDLKRFDPDYFNDKDKTEIRESFGIMTGSHVFLFIGRIAAEKGIFELLSAFEAIRAEGFPVSLVLVGPLNDECGGETSITSNELQSKPDVHYVGFSERPEMFMAIADVLCLPSYREGFGTVVIEAAAMKVPTIGTRIFGLSDAVEDGVTGFLVDVRSSDALEAAMRKLLMEPGLRDKFANASQERCQRLFDSREITAAVAMEYIQSLTKAGFYAGE